MRKHSPITSCIMSLFMVAVMLTITSTPAISATIYQCVQKNDGQVRMVSPSTVCRPSEDSVILSIPVVVHGSVNNLQPSTNGAIGFSFSRIQAGQYVITFNTALDRAPDCVVSIINPPINEVAYCTQNNNNPSAAALGVSCRFLNAGTGAIGLLDWDFAFVCVL